MRFIVDFTSGDDTEIIAKTDDKAEAFAIGAAKQTEYANAGKHGIITCYENSTERGTPMLKCYEFWKV